MSDESVSAVTTIEASADALFAVLADPTKHAAIDGTGWVSEALDDTPLTAAGQVFPMAMYHPNHPDGDYEMFNEVQVFDPPRAISWKPGYREDGELRFGGWIWRYDLEPTNAAQTEVTLTYDWSAVPDSIRSYLHFPPFPPDHLTSSLGHLADLAAAAG